MAMAETSAKTSITNSEVTPVATKFAVSYIRVSTKAQTREDKSGVERQVQDYIEDLFQLDDPPILTKNDDLVIIGKDDPNPALKNLLHLEYEQNQYYVNIYNFHNYRSNILDNDLVPDHRILSDEEKEKVAKQYNIMKDENWPEISRFDPPAIAIGLRPGQVTEITRNSPTALETKYWRLCK